VCPGGCALGVSPGAQQQRAATHDLVAPATPANESWLGRKVVVTGLAASNMLNGRTGMCIFININNLYNIYINIYLYDLLRASAATGAPGTIASVDVDGRYSVALDTETRGVVETFLVTINATNLQAVVAPAALAAGKHTHTHTHTHTHKEMSHTQVA
jgi:hypothetical protein